MSALPLKADMCSALRHVGYGPIADIRSCSINLSVRVGVTVFDLLVRVRPPSGSKVQEGPHWLHRTDMTWVLFLLGRHEQQFGGPAQPDDTIRALMEPGEDRHLLHLGIFTLIASLAAIVRRLMS